MINIGPTLLYYIVLCRQRDFDDVQLKRNKCGPRVPHMYTILIKHSVQNVHIFNNISKYEEGE